MKNTTRPVPLIFEQGAPGRVGHSLPAGAFARDEVFRDLSPHLRQQPPLLPEVSELEVVRHYTRLSQLNFSVDTEIYPLGSCTMKYNPRFAEMASLRLPFAGAHPYEPEALHQDVLAILHRTADYLGRITGLPAVSLQPAAGAHGELTGLMLIRAALGRRGDPRRYVIVPDTAHGTNPASAALCGYQVRPMASTAEGILSAKLVAELMDDDVAALMITNPNTLGIFEREILDITSIVHERGGLVYMDGANMNALMGVVRPADMGVDVMHLNFHKTFSTPHGGGGPGSGPVAAVTQLEPFLPRPVVRQREDGTYWLDQERPDSIGRVRSFLGNFGVVLKAYFYMRELGGAGLSQVSRHAVLASNYLRARLTGLLHLKYNSPTMHECVFDDSGLADSGVTTMDIAKRLIDHGIHPPTVYFPLVVNGALMVEPTETEPKETLDALVAALEAIVAEARKDPELLHQAPHSTPVRRLDEISAARQPRLHYTAT